MRPIALLASGFLISGILFTGVSCEKETDCKAVIRCKDSAGVSVPGAFVELYAIVKSADGKTTYTSDIKANASTDGSGQANFTFKLPAILDVRATLATSTRTFMGTGIIKLEEGTSVEKEVTMR